MANVTQEDVKHKIQAVREVVPSRSNTDIIFVLQYYDNDIERATQAFLEDGGKEALDQWNISGNKTVAKKKKKNKKNSRGDGTTASSTSTTSTLVSSHAIATTTTTTTSSTSTPITHNSLPLSNTNKNDLIGLSNRHTLPNGYTVGPTPNISNNSKEYSLTTKLSEKIHSELSTDINNHDDAQDNLPISSTASTLDNLSNKNHTQSVQENCDTISLTSSTVATFNTDNHTHDTVSRVQEQSTPVLNNHSQTSQHIGKPDLQPHSILDNHKSQISQSSKSINSAKSLTPRQKPTNRKSSNDKDVGVGGGFGSPKLARKTEKLKLNVDKRSSSSSRQTDEIDSGNKENLKKINSESNQNNHFPSAGQHTSHSARPKNLLALPIERVRTSSERSISSVTTTSTVTGGDEYPFKTHHKDHRGLEKSQKDLQRTLTSLSRQRNVLPEGCATSHKYITRVFEQLRELLLEREAQIMLKLEHVKTEATEILAARHQQGMSLKTRVDRAFKLSDNELVELRADIKHFVSERKIDEDIATQNKCKLDVESIQKAIIQFGEVPPLKQVYSNRRGSLSSSISSSVTDPLTPLTPLTPYTPTSSTSPETLYLQQPILDQATKEFTAASGRTQLELPKSLTKVSNKQKTKDAAVSSTVHKQPTTLGAKVVSQSESLSKFELSEGMQAVIQNIKDQAVKGPLIRRSQTPAGRGRTFVRSNTSKDGPKGSGIKDLPYGAKGQGNEGRSAGQSLVSRTRTTSGSTTDDSSLSVDGQPSRNARRRQRQREKIKQDKQLNKNNTSSDNMKDTAVRNRQPTELSQKQSQQSGQDKHFVREVPNQSGHQKTARTFYRTPSPTKRSEHNLKEGNTTAKPGASNLKNSRGPESGSVKQSSADRFGSNVGSYQGSRGRGQRSRSMEQSPRQGNPQNSPRVERRAGSQSGRARYNQQKPSNHMQDNNSIPEHDAVMGNINKKGDSSASFKNTSHYKSFSSNTTSFKDGSNKTQSKQHNNYSTKETFEKDNKKANEIDSKTNDKIQPRHHDKKAATPDQSVVLSNGASRSSTGSIVANGSVENKIDELKLTNTNIDSDKNESKISNGNHVESLNNKSNGDCTVNNNNNNVVRNSKMCDHYYDGDDEDLDDKLMKSNLKSVKIEEHIYDDEDQALPQRQRKSRPGRKFGFDNKPEQNINDHKNYEDIGDGDKNTKIVNGLESSLADKNHQLKNGCQKEVPEKKFEDVTNKQVKHLEMNGDIINEHRWSEEDLEQIS